MFLYIVTNVDVLLFLSPIALQAFDTCCNMVGNYIKEINFLFFNFEVEKPIIVILLAIYLFSMI